MNELVFLKSKQALTTSLKVAEVFEKRHGDVLQAVEDTIRQVRDTKKSVPPSLYQKSEYTHPQNGQVYPMYLMNRDGFTLLAMGFTGTKAMQFKLAYIDTFNRMEEILLNQRNEEWRAIRQAGKRGNKEMCAMIGQVIIPLAREAGSTAPDKVFYINYQKEVNKAAGIAPKSRDIQPLGQLYEIEKLQSMVGVSIKGLAARGEGYKQIFQDTKQTLENYSRLSLIHERFLLA